MSWYQVIAWSSGGLLAGFALDMLLGDPHGFPHIVRGMGGLIARLEKLLRRILPQTERGERLGGVLLVCMVALISGGVPFGLLFFSYRAFLPLGFALEVFLCYQLLATKSLKAESMKVYRSLAKGDINEARKNVAMIVGRDTSQLDEGGVTRAAVETVAENTSDGVSAPLLYIMLGGAALGCLYKSVNTMDSMVGYKNDRYLHFGRAGAKLDDILNYLPSRICAILMILAACLLGLDGKGALRIWQRDRRNHASPNSAQTEAVCAGALGIRLAGPISYFGRVADKPYIGDDTRPIRPKDIVLANRLMYLTAVLTLAAALLFRIILVVVLYAKI